MSNRSDLFDFEGAPLQAPVATKAPEDIHVQEEAPLNLQFHVHPTTPLTWKQSDIQGLVKEVRINKTLREYMDDWTSFRNWVYTVITSHLAINPLDAIEYALPDQFSDELGVKVITVETFSKEALSMKVVEGRRMQPVLGESIIHVLL